MYQRSHSSKENLYLVPCLEMLGWLHGKTDPGTGSGEDDAAGLESISLATESHKFWDVEDEIVGVTVLAELTVYPGF